jgi:hypothetical protein
MLEPGLILSFGVMMIGVVVWAVRIEGRINGHDQLFVEKDKLADERHEDIKARLIRIEDKLDRDHKGMKL